MSALDCSEGQVAPKDVSPDIASLRRQHKQLDAQIVEMQRRPAPDQCELTALKRRKAQVKSDLARLTG